MFGSIKKALGQNLIRSSFNSAIEHVYLLPIHSQREIAEKVKRKTLESLSEDPFILEQKLIALNQQAKFMRQTLTRSGLATNQSDPAWLEAAILESFALAGMSGDRSLFDYVAGSVSTWIERVLA